MIRNDLPTSDKEIAFTEKLKNKNSASKAEQENVVLKAFKHRLAQKNAILKEDQARRNAPILKHATTKVAPQTPLLPQFTMNLQEHNTGTVNSATCSFKHSRLNSQESSRHSHKENADYPLALRGARESGNRLPISDELDA